GASAPAARAARSSSGGQSSPALYSRGNASPFSAPRKGLMNFIELISTEGDGRSKPPVLIMQAISCHHPRGDSASIRGSTCLHQRAFACKTERKACWYRDRVAPTCQPDRRSGRLAPYCQTAPGWCLRQRLACPPTHGSADPKPVRADLSGKAAATGSYPGHPSSCG